MTIKDQIHALRWRAAADALALDPSYDPSLAALREIQKRADDFSAVSDLLAERMALLDAERPGVTLIECVQGMLEATAQKPVAPGTVDMLEVLADGSIEVHKNRDGQTGRILSPLAAMRGRAEAAELRAERAEEALAAADIEGIWARSNSRADALRVLGWSGEGDPKAWAEGQVASPIAGTPLLPALDRILTAAGIGREVGEIRVRVAKLAERQSGCDVHAKLETATRDAKTRGDALRVLGWNGAEHPEAWAPRRARQFEEAQKWDSEQYVKLREEAEALRAAAIEEPRRVVLLAAVVALGWTPECGSPLPWARATAREHKSALESLTTIDDRFRAARAELDASVAAQRELKEARDKATIHATIHAKRWVQACKATGHDPDGEGLIANTKKAIEALVEPLRAATHFHGEPTPARVVEEAVTMLGRLGREHEAMAAQIAVIDKAIGLTAGVERVDRLASLVHDAATCEQHRRLVDAIDEAMDPAFVGATCIPGPVLDRAQELVRRVMSVDKAPPLSEAIAAAHRWRAADLQALLDHERHIRVEADKDLVELTRPVWALMPRGAPRDMSPRGVVKQMAEILAAVAPALPSAGETE